jgi:hypothetical protein
MFGHSIPRSLWSLPNFSNPTARRSHRPLTDGVGKDVLASLQRQRNAPSAIPAKAVSPGGKPRLAGEKPPSATLFHEPWWLDVASDGAYEEAVVTSDGAVIARLPYLRLRKIGWQTALVMPTMTHVLGPSLALLPGSGRTVSLKRFTICAELIAQLPKASHVWFALHQHTTETLAFEAAGFITGVSFTAEIAPASPDVLWRQMRDKTRNVIRRAEEALTVRDIRDPSLFIEFYEENLRRRALTTNYDLRICGNLMAACLQRGCGRLLVAVDVAGQMQAAIFTAWDHVAEYYLMSTRDPDSGNGAASLLVWTALQDAAAAGRIFDMDGINVQTNHLLITGFGGVIKSRYTVNRSSTGFQVAHYVKGRFAKRAPRPAKIRSF